MKFDELVEALAALESARLEIILKEMNSRIRESVRSGARLGGVTYPKLARCLMFYALSLADQKRTERTSKSNYNAPQWSQVAAEISRFNEDLPQKVARCTSKVFDDDRVAQFATLSSRTRGSTDAFFYSTILLFVLQLHSRGKLDTDYYRDFAPDDALLLNSDIMQQFDIRLRTSPVNEGLVEQREVNVRFNVLDEKTKRLTEFFNNFAFGKDGMLHAMVYRPMRSEPKSLMKTFLAISPPSNKAVAEIEHDSFTFAHFYRPPQPQQMARFSGGKVLPLQDGVYLIGGQRILRPDNIRYPFQSIKVIALRWHDIEHFHSVLPAVVLSTNYQAQMFVSRAAIRLTPISHSNDARLGSVEITQLDKEIAQDLKNELTLISTLSEEQYLAKEFANYRTYAADDDDAVVRQIAAKISDMTNNTPNRDRGWDVPDGVTRKSAKRTEPLTKARLQVEISEALAGTSGDAYKYEGGEFDLFRHTRFGPLVIE